MTATAAPPADAAAAAQAVRLALARLAPAAAVATARATAAAFPDDLGLHLLLAEAADYAGDPRAQLAALEQAANLARREVARRPLDPATHLARGQLEYRLGHYTAAAHSYRRVLARCPGHPLARFGLARAGLALGDWSALDGFDPAVVPGLVAAGAATPSNLVALPVPGTGPALLAAGRIESARLASGIERLPPRRVRAGEPLHLGYVSPDFNDHAVGRQLPRVLELHDRRRVRVFAYDIGRDDGSDCRRRLLAACDVVRDGRALSDAALAAQIAADGIDLLVDLAGHTLGSRLGVFAHRPAPIQVSWLGYPASTGADFIDYLVVDPVVAAPALRPHYHEAVARLPYCYLPADNLQAVAPVRPTRTEAGLPETGTVFAAFHQACKLDGALVATWLRLLQHVDGSVLWLRCREEARAEALRAAAAAAGLDPSRLVFAAASYPKAEYLARLGLADLWLDTRWFNGHSSVSDALWAGVPVVTCRGDSFAGLVAASILTAAGLPEGIARDLADYEERAVALVRDPGLRARVAAARERSAFFDAAAFVSSLETAYTVMAERARAGFGPADFDVPPPPPSPRSG
jgi:protein O-GlcNAc transferase